MAVVGYLGGEEVIGFERLAAELVAEDQCVACGAGAEHMLIEERAFAVIARVVEAGAVWGEGDAEIASGREFVLKRFAGFQVQDANGGLVRATLLKPVGYERSVAGGVHEAD